jgi:hypothetical protein
LNWFLNICSNRLSALRSVLSESKIKSTSLRFTLLCFRYNLIWSIHRILLLRFIRLPMLIFFFHLYLILFIIIFLIIKFVNAWLSLFCWLKMIFSLSRYLRKMCSFWLLIIFICRWLFWRITFSHTEQTAAIQWILNIVWLHFCLKLVLIMNLLRNLSKWIVMILRKFLICSEMNIFIVDLLW